MTIITQLAVSLIFNKKYGCGGMKKKIFITGVTGTMGSEGLKELLKYKDKLEITIIVRPSKKNKRLMKDLAKDNVEIIWGDIINYEDVKKGVKDADYILHVAALVSPRADYYPKEAWNTNVGSIKNILQAIEELNKKNVKLVYVGTVAQTGDRIPPIHWGRVGDPLKPSVYDNYAVTKIMAERMVMESGLEYWVSLRQTGILHFGLINILDGIIFHQPLNNKLEWVTARDSGRLLANICIKDLPDKFWRNVYNIGGGRGCRANNYKFMSMMFEAMGIKDIRKIFEPNWFAIKNFHGQYYLDSDTLDDYLDFRRETLEDFIEQFKKNIKFPVTILKYLPKPFIKRFIMYTLAKSENGPLNWIKNNEKGKIDAFFGSYEQWEKIGGWDDFSMGDSPQEPIILSHGYDESKKQDKLKINDMMEAAKFRGGKCLSTKMIEGDLISPLKWRCGFSHEFEANPTTVLLGGHWCPECEAPPWNYDEIAKKNPFFAQVWR